MFGQTNCLAEVLYDAALARAQELDDHLNSTGQVVGPLHGLPISVKEHIFLAGSISTSGLIVNSDLVSDTDSHIVEIFRKAGAVFHVKTTDPQGLLVSNHRPCKSYERPFGLMLCTRLSKQIATYLEER